MKNYRTLISFMLLMFPSLLFSQAALNNPCPGGGVPSGGRCVSPAEASANNNNRSTGVRYVEIWEDRFGAIAQDFESGTGGVAENEKSKRNAEKLAMKRCGNNRCKLVSSARNSCQAAAWGGGGGIRRRGV